MEQAKARLLATTEPVGSLATTLGYKNGFYFSRRFKLRVGVSPSAFREGVRAPQE
jgi:YesN/AraC family two-component response regulator